MVWIMNFRGKQKNRSDFYEMKNSRKGLYGRSGASIRCEDRIGIWPFREKKAAWGWQESAMTWQGQVALTPAIASSTFHNHLHSLEPFPNLNTVHGKKSNPTSQEIGESFRVVAANFSKN